MGLMSKLPAHRVERGWAGLLAMFLAMPLAMLFVLLLWGCTDFEDPKSSPAVPRDFLSDAPRVTLSGGGDLRGDLSILLPQGYVLESEVGATMGIYHLWRRKLAPLKEDVTLSIVAGPVRLAHCPQEAPTLASIDPTWKFPWRDCALTVPGLRARESFPKGPSGRIIQLVVIGAAGTEADRLQAIGESLRTP